MHHASVTFGLLRLMTSSADLMVPFTANCCTSVNRSTAAAADVNDNRYCRPITRSLIPLYLYLYYVRVGSPFLSTMFCDLCLPEHEDLYVQRDRLAMALRLGFGVVATEHLAKGRLAPQDR